MGYDNEAVEMDDRTPRIIVDEVDEEINEEVLIDLARNRVSNSTEASEKSRKASATSQLTDGSHRSSVSRRLSSSLRIDIDLDDDPEFQVDKCLNHYEIFLWKTFRGYFEIFSSSYLELLNSISITFEVFVNNTNLTFLSFLYQINIEVS